MRSAVLFGCLFLLVHIINAQNVLEVVVKDLETGEPLPGATASINTLKIGGVSDENGLIRIEEIPDGNYKIKIAFVGYETQTLSLLFPRTTLGQVEVSLGSGEEELEEVVITSTRSSRTIADVPTRVEFIAGEELDEKANMKPGDIRMLLSESTGIQTQQTSATSANASIRIQGLDGRYTQILKDGFPLYAGFSGGLGLLQTPPLDLKQVEVIKGSSSTLYGGGAIAGMVNLISKTPSEERELRLLANVTSAKGLDLSGFYGKDFGKLGMTLFVSRNTNKAYDPADIDLTAIPEFERYTINPKLFLDLSEMTKLQFGLNYTNEDRIGGDIHYIEGNGDANHRYFEKNDSKRYSTQFSFSHKFTESTELTIKNSFNHFDRSIAIPDYTFDGNQNSSFTELNVSHTRSSSEWVGGLNVWTDEFSESQVTSTSIRDYSQTTLGGFIQNTYTFSEKVSTEVGIRGDYIIDYGFVFLPRISILYKMNEYFTSRLGGGLGYKTPTLFTEEIERIHYQGVLPISSDANDLEKSYGANWDLNFRSEIGPVSLSINHLFFYTYLDNPLKLLSTGAGTYALTNLRGFIDSKGTETNLKLEYNDFKLFIGYTFTDTKIHDNGTSIRNPLTARHRLNNVLMYELDEKWKIGLEAYYFSKQRLSDDTFGKDYWICGFMIEKLWERFSLYVNFENFLDARQTRFDTIFNGTVSNPVFRDIYAPVDGFVINGGVKIDFSSGNKH